MPVYMAVSARILVNMEALNMAESVGNVVRHRRAPVVFRTGTGFVLRYVPVVSGESLAHHYQRLLAELAKQRGLPVCKACSQGVFLKHADRQVFKTYDGIADPKKKFGKGTEVEKYIVENCVVEDIGGFLFTDMTIKRTSRFRVGYMVPALDALEKGAAATEAQFHVRYSPGAQAGQQAIYYVEVGSAVYVFNYALDASAVGMYSAENPGYSEKTPYILSKEERLKRVELAVDALAALLGGMAWGAKTSRFMPHWKVVSLVAAVASPIPFTVSPGHDKHYLVETVERACTLAGMVGGFNATIYYYDDEGLDKPRACSGVAVEASRSYLEALNKAKQALLEKLRREE
ncbi:MAG: type I-A CRISPR-associated protein Cas7/Csa2 [Crenarchaeota archaeon]|nr:type I-A CRISPR-associated protein Cas7/Csa2 [Thermoproteota archaeon]